MNCLRIQSDRFETVYLIVSAPPPGAVSLPGPAGLPGPLVVQPGAVALPAAQQPQQLQGPPELPSELSINTVAYINMFWHFSRPNTQLGGLCLVITR